VSVESHISHFEYLVGHLADEVDAAVENNVDRVFLASGSEALLLAMGRFLMNAAKTKGCRPGV